MKVLVTGATGFTGSYVVPLLCRNSLTLRCLLRPTSQPGRNLPSGIEWVYGDVDELESLQNAMRGMDALVNIVSLGFGSGPGIVKAAEKVGLSRAIFISTTAIFTTLPAPSKAVRLAAERVIEQSSLAYTILRPTMIYGSSRDRNMCRLIRYLHRWPAIPIFGTGECLQQPVFVEDLAAAIHGALRSPATCRKAYNVAGADALSYNEVIGTVCRLLDRKVRRMHLPAGLAIGMLRALEKLPLRLPLKSEQLQRLNEDKAFRYTEAAQDFGYSPRTFAEGIRAEVAELGLRGAAA